MGTPPRDHRAACRYPARCSPSCFSRSAGAGPLCAGMEKFGGALEDRELAGLAGDERDGLDARRAGADDRDPLAREVDTLVRPAAGEVDLAGETAGAFDVGRLGHREAAGGHDVVPAPDLRPAAGGEPPPVLLLVPAGGGDGGGKLDVRTQPVAVGHELEVVQDLRLRGVLLRPGPFLLQFRVEAVGVVRGGDVTAGPGIAVPVPRPADIARRVEDLRRQPELAQPVEHVQAGETGARYHHVELLGDRSRLVHEMLPGGTGTGERRVRWPRRAMLIRAA